MIDEEETGTPKTEPQPVAPPPDPKLVNTIEKGIQPGTTRQDD